MPLTRLSLSSSGFERMFPFAWDGVGKLQRLPRAPRPQRLLAAASLPGAAATPAANPTPFTSLPAWIPTDRAALSLPRDGNRGAAGDTGCAQTAQQRPTDRTRALNLPQTISLVTSVALLQEHPQTGGIARPPGTSSRPEAAEVPAVDPSRSQTPSSLGEPHPPQRAMPFLTSLLLLLLTKGDRVRWSKASREPPRWSSVPRAEA